MTQKQPDDKTIDRLRGMLIGLAVGDALGAAVEFKERGTFPPVIGYRGGGPHGLGPGEWTDDTSMALALADSLAGGFDVDDQAFHYLSWYRRGRYSVTGRCFDIGNQTRQSLSRFERTRSAANAADPSELASGNGSIMRLAPVPIRYHALLETDPAALAQFGEQSSVPTHSSDMCRAACRWLTLVLAGLATGVPRELVISPDWPVAVHADPVPAQLAPVFGGLYRVKSEDQIVGGGYVVDCLEASLWAFHDAPDFEHALLVAVNLGDDADTTGAVCGQLAGAYWGESGIPEEWRKGVAHYDWLDAALNKLLKL